MVDDEMMTVLRRPLSVSIVLLAAAAFTGCTGPSSVGTSATETSATETPATETHATEIPPSRGPSAGTDPADRGDEQSPAPSQEREPVYADLAALRAALEATGVDCSVWTQDDLFSGALESGWCEASSWGLATYASRSDLAALLELDGESSEPQSFLAGDTWSVTRGYEDPAALDEVRPALGGIVYHPGDVFPD
ncbi:MAG: hypothetical protein RI885_2588 [Actinomycetota bacterium]|jgi:hypothetical protein